MSRILYWLRQLQPILTLSITRWTTIVIEIVGELYCPGATIWSVTVSSIHPIVHRHLLTCIGQQNERLKTHNYETQVRRLLVHCARVCYRHRPPAMSNNWADAIRIIVVIVIQTCITITERPLKYKIWVINSYRGPFYKIQGALSSRLTWTCEPPCNTFPLRIPSTMSSRLQCRRHIELGCRMHSGDCSYLSLHTI